MAVVPSKDPVARRRPEGAIRTDRIVLRCAFGTEEFLDDAASRGASFVDIFPVMAPVKKDKVRERSEETEARARGSVGLQEMAQTVESSSWT